MKKIIQIFKMHNGYSRMKGLREAGIQTRDIATAIQDGVITKIKPGLYRLVDYPWDEHSSFADVCHANKKAVICLLSAASYYELTTFNPPEVYVAVPNNTDKFILQYPPIRVYYYSDKYYNTGIESIKTHGGIVNIYNREKTIADLFRYTKKIGEDIAVESLKEYIRKRKTMNIALLIKYAEAGRVRKKIEPMLKVLLS